jgi:hypothetical protein
VDKIFGREGKMKSGARREVALVLTHKDRLKIFKDSVRTAKKTPHFTVTKINRLTLFKEIIAVYCENQLNHINKQYRVNECGRWCT